MKRLLVTTGNGMFGRALVNQLAGSPDITVRAMVRNVAGFDVEASNVEVVQADMDDPATLVNAVDGVTDVFLCTPMDEHIATREIAVIDAVKATGNDVRVLKLHGAVDHRGDHLSSLHQQSIDHLKQSGLRWTLICPNSVMETSLLPLAGSVAFGGIAGTSGHGKVGFVALGDVAEATAAVSISSKFVGQSVMLTGPTAVDMYEVANALTQVLGKVITYTNMSEDDFAKMVIEFGVFPDREAVEMQVLCHYRAWARGDASLVADGFEQATGRKPRSVHTWLTENRDRFAS